MQINGGMHRAERVCSSRLVTLPTPGETAIVPPGPEIAARLGCSQRLLPTSSRAGGGGGRIQRHGLKIGVGRFTDSGGARLSRCMCILG